MSSVILIQLIKPYGFISPVNAKHTVFKPFNKQKMGTPLSDATLTLKQQEKIVNIFFLQQNIFFYKKMYVYHFYQKMHTGLTQRPTLKELISLLSITLNNVVSVRKGFFFLFVCWMGCVIFLWHYLSLPYNYFS